MNTQTIDLTHPLVVPLTNHRLILVNGPDAEKFLQGQCTCDITRVIKGEFVLGAQCSAKGRMHSSFVAAQISESVIGLRIHASIAESALAALQKYAVFSKVNLSISSDYVLLAGFNINDTFSTLPDIKTSACSDKMTLLRHDDAVVEAWATSEAAAEAWLTSNENYSVSENDTPWQLFNMQCGIAEIRNALPEQLLPQELNFQLIDGISFKKGCYTGQEIIARLHYKGSLKKHLYIVELESSQPLKEGQKIANTDASVRSRGELVNILPLDADHFLCLALCDDTLVGETSLALDENTVVKSRWLKLPYAIN